jgi:hypothetical protein
MSSLPFATVWQTSPSQVHEAPPTQWRAVGFGHLRAMTEIQQPPTRMGWTSVVIGSGWGNWNGTIPSGALIMVLLHD